MKTAEVNFLGTKLVIAEVGLPLKGLEIRDDRIWFQRQDVTAMPATIDQLGMVSVVAVSAQFRGAG